MSRLYVGNFDFEHDLAGVKRPGAARSAADLALCWVAIASDGDAIVTAAMPEADFAESIRAASLPVPKIMTAAEAATADHSRRTLTPWGWSAAVRRLTDSWNVVREAPPEHAVRAANSRRLSFEIEEELQAAPEGSALVCSLAELQRRLTDLPDPDAGWILKAEFGMSGREQIRGRGTSLSTSACGWLSRRLTESGVVFLEPQLQLEDEVGVQYTLAATGSLQLDGVIRPLITSTGMFAGCQLLPGSWTPPAIVEKAARHLATRLHCLGYFGPFNIDVAWSRTSDGAICRPVQDLNARYSMGRLALGFRRHFREPILLAWLLVPWRRAGSAESFLAKATQLAGDAVRVVRTSPFYAGDRPVELGSILLIARSQHELDTVVSDIVDPVPTREVSS